METNVNANPVVAIVGATGAVGAEFIAVMNKRNFPVRELKAFASARSAGKTFGCRGATVAVEELTEASFEGIDIALFSAGSGIAKRFAPAAVKSGAVVIDNSSAFRMDPDVPLVIPEINARRIADHNGIIANPNCAAITALVPLWPIHLKNRIKRVVIATYQAGRLHSNVMASQCARNTGTRTQVTPTAIRSSSKIFLVSLMTLVSSPL